MSNSLPIEPLWEVELLRDYSYLHKSLCVGARGRTTAIPLGRAALDKNHWISVTIDGITFDMPRSHLKIIDERFQKWQQNVEEETTKLLRDSVEEATCYTTLRGGFVKLVIKCKGEIKRVWTRKKACAEIMADLERRGLLQTKKLRAEN